MYFSLQFVTQWFFNLFYLFGFFFWICKLDVMFWLFIYIHFRSAFANFLNIVHWQLPNSNQNETLQSVVCLLGSSLMNHYISNAKKKKTQHSYSEVHIPFTGKFHIFDSLFFYLSSIIEAASVRQVYQQTHLHLRIGQNHINTAQSEHRVLHSNLRGTSIYLQAFEIVGQHAGMKPVLLRDFIIIPWSKHGFHGQKFTWRENFMSWPLINMMVWFSETFIKSISMVPQYNNGIGR